VKKLKGGGGKGTSTSCGVLPVGSISPEQSHQTGGAIYAYTTREKQGEDTYSQNAGTNQH